MLLVNIWSLIKFNFNIAYNLFMSVNLITIGSLELKRIKKMVNLLLSDIKELRIRERSAK